MSIPTRAFIANFNGGELSPLLDARVDAGVYRNGCRKLENFIVRPYGGAFKRPGTEYGGAVKTAGTATRLIPFKRSTNTNNMLELGANYIRVWTGGSSMTQVNVSGVTAWATTTAYVVGDVRSNGGVNYWCRTAHTSGTFATDLAAGKWHAMTGTVFEAYSPYAAADLFQVQFCQINDVMFLAHPSYPPQRLSRFGATSWAMEEIGWDFAPMGDVNDTSTTVTIQPNVANWATATLYQKHEVVLHQGLLYYAGGSTSHTSGTFATDLANGWWTLAKCRGVWERGKLYALGDIIESAGVLYVNIFAVVAADADRPTSGASWASYWQALSANGLRLFSSAALFSVSNVGESWRIDIGASQRTLFLSGVHSNNTTYLTEPLFIQGSMLVRSNFNTTSKGPDGDLFLDESRDGITFDSVRSWRFTNRDGNNISSEFEGAVTGAYYRLHYNNFQNGAVSEGFFLESVNGLLNCMVRITGYTSATEVTCTFALPNATRAPSEVFSIPTTLWHRPAFRPASYPRTVAFHDSRLFWGGVANEPSRLWGSRIDDYYNYLTTADDDSGLDLTLAASEANQIEWLTSFGRSLVCGTTGEEWTIDSGETDAVLTPTSVRARRRTRNGSAAIAPQLVADALLWTARGDRRMQELSYDFTSDSYQAPDMTQLAEHVTAGGIVQTAFSKTPDSVLWAVTGNGVLLGFTYDRAQQITAWHRHTTDGTFESVATIYGASGRDEVWFVVKRTVNGSDVRYIERFYPTAQNYDYDTATDLFYVDCGKKITQSSSTAVSGLSHLNAKAVAVVADGARIESKSVSAGAITLTTAATNVIVGLPFTSTVQPMKQEIMLQDGTGQGRHMRANRVVFRLHKSYGGQFADTVGGAAQDIDARTPYQIEQSATLSAALQTIEVQEHIKADWLGSVDFNVTHASPLPFNLLGYVLVYEVEGR